jgi:alpha-tubulin suppressor-like RCC1 family protein
MPTNARIGALIACFVATVACVVSVSVVPAMAEEAAGGRFRVEGGVVVDAETGLMWTREATLTGEPMPIQQASEVLRRMNRGEMENFGHADWRLPTLEEMARLTGGGWTYPSLPPEHLFHDVRNEFYWTSTGGISTLPYAWIVDLGTGMFKRDQASYCSFHYLWPVRVEEKHAGASDQAPAMNADTRTLKSELDFLVSEGSCASDVGDSDAPMPPASVVVVPISTEELLLTWDSPPAQSGIAWYNVYDGDVLVKTVTEPEALMSGLEPGQRMCLSVSAYTGSGMESERGETVCATTFQRVSRGMVWASGLNNYGQLGDGTRKDRRVLASAGGVDRVLKVAAGMEHSVALDLDGTVWTWGHNSRGQLGDNSTRDRLSPGAVPGVSKVTDIAAGWYHTLALKADGTVWAWGRNYYGQLGNGTTRDQLQPVQVKGLYDIRSIAAGWYHSLAIDGKGRVWAWGSNFRGQLGTGERHNELVPTQVPLAKRALQVDGGMYHTLALLEGGTVWAWGRNDAGQLGIGTREDTVVPMQVKGLGVAREVAAGMYFSLGLLADGTVWAWGKNDYGQVGAEANVDEPEPVMVRKVSDVRAITAGAHHAAALLTDGEALAWGWDYAHGQRNSPPMRVGSVSGFAGLSAGVHFTLFVKGE